MKKNNLWILLGMIAALLASVILLSILLFSKKTQAVGKTPKQQNILSTQVQSIKKEQPIKKQPSKPVTPPFDEDISTKIKKVFEPILSETESEKLGRSYATKGYHIRIMPDLYDDLNSQHLSAEEQDKYKKTLAAHQQALEILRQNNVLKAKQLSADSVPTPKKKEEFYLPGLTAIKGLKGQPQINIKEIACSDRYIAYENWNKICQEIRFADGTKSVVYIVTARGVTAREDFDAQGHLLVQHRFWTTGGYFDSKKIRHIPDYPSTLSESIFYNRDSSVNKIEIYSFNATAADKTKQSLEKEFATQQQMPSIIVQSNKNLPQYCDLYKSECIAL